MLPHWKPTWVVNGKIVGKGWTVANVPFKPNEKGVVQVKIKAVLPKVGVKEKEVVIPVKRSKYDHRSLKDQS